MRLATIVVLKIAIIFGTTGVLSCCMNDANNSTFSPVYSDLLVCDTLNALGIIPPPKSDSSNIQPVTSWEKKRLTNVCRVDSTVYLYFIQRQPARTRVELNGRLYAEYRGDFGRVPLDGLRNKNIVIVKIIYLGDDPYLKGKTNTSNFYFSI